MAVFELEESDYAGPMEEDSIFNAEVVSVRAVVAPFKDKETGEDVHQVEFKFVIEDEGAWDGQNIFGYTSTKFNTHPDCKLRNWSQEILATELPAGYRLDTDLLVGNGCRLVIGAREREKNGETRIVNFVKDVIRPQDAMGDEAPF